ncbi:hypothetical protein HaLaN_19583 [Haematococcus lacustris]|uniref:F-box domain-containing protein n=1 Tax=Haematococcus lacustris TaxID=44745 RepID=A0A699ZTS8_HAELA|nr:hypothetical protein HaLaN_19583 [Haematococcus lacustris]
MADICDGAGQLPVAALTAIAAQSSWRVVAYLRLTCKRWNIACRSRLHTLSVPDAQALSPEPDGLLQPLHLPAAYKGTPGSKRKDP